MKSDKPLCPRCQKLTEWNFDGTKPVFCPTCLEELVLARIPGSLDTIAAWLGSSRAGLLGVFNLLAISLFVHAASYRMSVKEATIQDSWLSFLNSSSHARILFGYLEDGNWTDSDCRTLVSRLREIHDAAFHGQWAMPIPQRHTMSYKINGVNAEDVRLMLNGAVTVECCGEEVGTTDPKEFKVSTEVPPCD